jgi:chemotaxis protein MotB
MSEQQPEVKIKFVKKKGGHAAAHGGAWKIAYADLVTAMMAFFLLMWLLNSANANTKTGLAKYFSEGPDFFKTPEGMAILSAHSQGILTGGRGMKPVPDLGDAENNLTTDQDAAEKEHKAMEETAQAIEHAFSSDQLLQTFQDQISMDFTDEGLRIQVQDRAAQVLFDSGSAHLKPYTLAILKEIAQELGKLPNRVVIGGHTDSVQYPSQAYTNWELSAERANAARRVLQSSGLHSGQVERVTGYADSVPLEGHEPQDPQNRRISIVVLSSATLKQETEQQKSKGDASKPQGGAAKTP